jgi:hypothetical protein
MAKLQITVRRKGSGRLVAHETFEISRELAQELVAKMEAMIAELPGRHRTTRTCHWNHNLSQKTRHASNCLMTKYHSWKFLRVQALHRQTLKP